MYQKHTKVCSFTLSYLVAGSKQCWMWISTNYMRPHGKWSLFVWQHLVRSILAWWAIIVFILDGKYAVYCGLKGESFDNVAVHGGQGITVHDFRWINGSNPLPEVNWFNAHSIHVSPNQVQVWTQPPMCIKCALNSILLFSVKRP